MSIVNAYGERRQEEVMRETWGHLSPVPGKTYRGTVAFACAAYGGVIAILSIEFTTTDGQPLLDNPWSYENLTDYIAQWVCDQANGWRDCKPIPTTERLKTDGKVLCFTGSYTRFKNNSCRIAGQFHQLTGA
jgi:hypothetical protein